MNDSTTTCSDPLYDWLGIESDPRLCSPVHRIKLAGKRAVFGKSRLDENSQLKHHANGAFTLFPLCATPLVPPEASIAVRASERTLQIGIDVGPVGGIDDDMARRWLPIHFRASPDRRWMVDRLRLRPWSRLGSDGRPECELGRPSASPRTSLLSEGIERETGMPLDGPLAPTNALLRTGSDPWADFVCLPMTWFRDATATRLNEQDRPRIWFEIPWPETPTKEAAADMATWLELNVHLYVDIVASIFEGKDLERQDDVLIVRRKPELANRKMRVLCAIDVDSGDVYWDACWLWSTRGKLLHRLPCPPEENGGVRFRVPAAGRWRVLVTHRPESDLDLSAGQLVPGKSNLAPTLESASACMDGEVERFDGVDLSAMLTSGSDPRSAILRSVLGARALTRHPDFVAAVLDANVLGSARWVQPSRVQVQVRAGRVGGKPTHFAHVVVPLRAKHPFSELDLECAGAALSSQLTERSPINLPVRVEVRTDER